MALSNPDVIYNSYAGVDIVAELVLPNEPSMIVGELQTLSLSMHRENVPVRSVGHVNPIGFVKGPRTIAGSCIFTTFNSYVFYNTTRFATAVSQGLFPVADMLPPFDIVLSFLNEYGSISKMRIYGVTMIDEGYTMSIDDVITESTYSYMARGVMPMITQAMDQTRLIKAGSQFVVPLGGVSNSAPTTLLRAGNSPAATPAIF